jgi:hypothetical protein
MSRFKAAGIHLFLSVIIVLATLAVMWFVWYPKGMFKLLGGGELLLIISGVDVCLGPLLTLAVFNTAKKSLKMDLAIIGVIQIAALLYGMHVMFQSRPVFNVLEEDRFSVSLASDFKDNVRLKKAKKLEWQSLSWTGPQLVAAVGPTDQKEKEEIMFSGQSWNAFPQTYVDYDSQRQVALKNAKPLIELRKNKFNLEEIDAFLAKKGRPESDFVTLPIVYTYTMMAAILDAKTGDFIEIIDAKKE